MSVRIIVLLLLLPNFVFAAPKDSEKVVFTRENIKMHSSIKKEWLEIKDVEKRFLPSQPYFKSLKEVIGKYATEDSYMNEPLLKRRVADKNDIPYLSLHLKSEKNRIVTIKISCKSPPIESNIDILLAGKRIARNLRVVSTMKTKSVTLVSLEAQPRLSLKLLLAQKKGELQWLPSKEGQ